MSIDYQKILVEKINKLKKERNAIVLAHNYVLGEVQDVADYCGDSLELSRKAANITEDVIVFCGVKFMAETAKILSPQKTVLHPIPDAGCPMADMADFKSLREFKKKYPNAVVLAYVNTTAEIKTEVDICCTSGNADKVLSAIPKDKQVIFLPDKNLAINTAKKLSRDVIVCPGFCPTHMRITTEMIDKRKKEFPNAVVVVHPECSPDVVAAADQALSTSGILQYAKESKANEIIIGTEIGIIHRLQKENPKKLFIPISEQAVCMNMKKINLEDVVESLEKMQYQIILSEEIIKKAWLPIDRMLRGSYN